jgi:pyruvate dehydrogenase E2 component (dihydrolipoamide acetyltransferase)
MVQFLMPSLGADMEAGKLVEWMVKPGDRVKRGDIVAVVETQKGAIEIEIFEKGSVERLLVNLGTTVPVGTPLALIRAEGEPAAVEARPPGAAAAATEIVPPAKIRPAAEIPRPPPSAPAPRIAAAPPPQAPKVAAAPPPPPVAPVPAAAGRVRASPAARRLAESIGVDLAQVKATGPEGAIVRADVERGSRPGVAVAAPKPARGFDLDAMRVAIAAAMARSKREIPHYYLEDRVDVTAAQDWLARANASRPPDARLLMGALATKAVAVAAARHRAFNGFFRDGRFEAAASVHIGVAVAIRGGGLVAPAIHDAARITLDELMNQMRDLVARVRAGRIRSSEIADPTITISSLGERGVEALYGVIYPPQVAIIGFGKVAARPWVVEDRVVPRPVVAITLAADHRVSDGHAGALFLAEIGRLLEEPEKL